MLRVKLKIRIAVFVMLIDHKVRFSTKEVSTLQPLTFKYTILKCYIIYEQFTVNKLDSGLFYNYVGTMIILSVSLLILNAV